MDVIQDIATSQAAWAICCIAIAWWTIERRQANGPFRAF